MFSSLRTRLIVTCLSIVVFAMLAMTLANFAATRGRTMEALDAQMLQLSQVHSAGIAEWVHGKSLVVASLKLAADMPDPQAPIAAAKAAGAFDDAYIGYPDKKMQALHPMPPNYDPTARPWYAKATQNGGPILTAPYVDATTGKLVVTFAEAFGSKGAYTAVGGADVIIDTVVHNVLAIKPTPNSFSFLVDSTGVIIAHPDAKLTLKQVTDFDASLTVARLQQVEADKHAAEVSLQGRDGLLHVTKIAGTDWLLVIVLDRNEATAALSAMLVSSSIAAIVLTALAGLLLTVLVAKALQRLALIRDALEDIASGEGDLTKRLDADGGDELAQIAKAFNRFVDKIASVLQDIRGTSDAVRVSSTEIAAGNADLSARTESQASSLEETSSSMEELTSTVRQNADNAKQANQLALSASSVASKGGAVVSQVVETMGSIKESSNRIADIIGVIDGIAFQTNILALNAAVEAARAGEQGRGFAVVASEVRNLAQRSAAAAREIKTLIVDSGEKVDAGGRLVDDAGHTMGEIVQSVQRLATIMADITAASQEQSSGIEEVNRAITHMDEMTQQNSALVEESAAAAESLKEMALRLTEAVGGFKLDHRDAGAAPRAHAHAAVPGGAAPVAIARPPVAVKAAPAARTAAPRAVAPRAVAPRTATPPKVAPNTAKDEWEEF